MDFIDYQAVVNELKLYPEDQKVNYPVLGLNGEAGEVADKLKKVYRDKGGEINDETRDALLKELGDCLWYIAAAADDLKSNIKIVALMNANKLLDRKKREQLQGDGDER